MRELLVPVLVSVLVSSAIQDSKVSAAQAAKVVDLKEVELDSLAWLAGTWRIESRGQVIEERWSPPLGNAMTGTLRWTRNGQVWMYEFMIIEKTKDGISFHLRHFGPGSVAWEGKKEALSYPLAKISDDEVVFENPKRDKPRRFLYARDGRDKLVASFEGPDGKGQKFPFRRATK